MESGARQQIVELLGGVPLFSELTQDELDRVAQVAIRILEPPKLTASAPLPASAIQAWERGRRQRSPSR